MVGASYITVQPQSTMDNKEFVKTARKLSSPFRITDGEKFKLKSIDPEDTGPFEAKDKKKVNEALSNGVEVLAGLQDRLYAQDKRSLLLIFQAMDAAGKDGAIKHVMSGINPQGCQVASFKSPSSEELDHDYLWRCMKHLPERGRIGIFNRSYYEEVLVVKVHPEFLGGQKLPPELIGKDIWEKRYKDIRNFENYLTRNGTVVRKFFLHLGRDEQKKRFLERIDRPEKNWKLSPSDAKERGYWDDYMDAYQEMIRNTATEKSPWYVVPANNKWFTRAVVAAAVIDAMAEMDLAYPVLSSSKLKDIAAVKEMLLAEKD
jgi:PPK2 family polyphosphate:nucleotide phosphotransferase